MLGSASVLGKGLSALFLLTALATGAQAQDASAPIKLPALKVAADQSAVSEPKYRPIALRLGGNFSPQTGPAFGLDFTPRGLHLAPGLSTRFDLDAAFNTRGSNSLQGQIDPIVSFTIDQIYSSPQRAKGRAYVGAGFGLYTGPTGRPINNTISFNLFGTSYLSETKFGGKLFVGADFTPTTAGEASVHFADSTTLVMVQLRLKL